MTGGWWPSSCCIISLPFTAVFEVVVAFFRLLNTPTPRFLFPGLLVRVAELRSTDSFPFFVGLLEGGGGLFTGEPTSVRGESAENKASILDFYCLSRRRLQRTSPIGASGFFSSRAWLGLGGELACSIRGCGSMGAGSGNFVSLGGVLWSSDWAGVGGRGSVARVASCSGEKGPCGSLIIISA